MFIDNKYKKWYDSIVLNARNRNAEGYTEKHHIVPRSLGGSDDASNLVKLTAKEHFVCHRLLTKFVVGTFLRKKMLNAVGKFVQSNSKQERRLTSRQYEVARISIAEANTGREYTDEMRQKMSAAGKNRIPWNKGLQGKQQYPSEAKDKLSQLYTNKSFEDRFGELESAEIKKRISESKLGKPSGMLGKLHSEETKKKMSENMKGARGPQTRIAKCPHCSNLEVTPRHIKFCKGNK